MRTPSQRVFKAIDTDGSGSLSYMEFVDAFMMSEEVREHNAHRIVQQVCVCARAWARAWTAGCGEAGVWDCGSAGLGLGARASVRPRVLSRQQKLNQSNHFRPS